MATLWDRLLFWKKPKKPKEGIDYQLYNFPDSDLTGIHLLKGVYQGVIYYYKMAQIVEEGTFARLKFTYGIENFGNHDEEALRNDQNFVIIMGDILTELLETNEQTRTNNTEEFSL